MRHQAARPRFGPLFTAVEVIGFVLFGVAIALMVIAALALRYSGWSMSLVLCVFAVVAAFAGACTRSAGGDR